MSHNLLVFLYLTNDVSLLKTCPFACEPGDIGHGWWSHMEPWEVGLDVKVFSCSRWIWPQEWMTEWDAHFWSFSGEIICSCLLVSSLSLCTAHLSLIAGRSYPPNLPGVEQSYAADGCLQPRAYRCCNQCYMSHSFPYSWLKTPYLALPLFPHWPLPRVLDRKENFYY